MGTGQATTPKAGHIKLVTCEEVGYREWRYRWVCQQCYRYWSGKWESLHIALASLKGVRCITFKHGVFYHDCENCKGNDGDNC